MSLLDTLKSLLGLGPSGTRDARTRDVDVTVEHDPGETAADTESEDAVKGTDDADSPTVEHDTGAVGTDDEDDAAGADGEDADDAAAEQAEETAAGTDESTEVIKGIGPSYADRLGEAGVETVADLAAADPADLSEATDISEKRLGRWVDRAKTR